ncbi:MAG: MFS transporter [Planctomycetales bacterium]|jgi:NNP family nitrate/nitrite transporter-like MFS transporter
MELQNKATQISLLDFKSPQMRAFHMTWFAFFLCFFGWFGMAPLMILIRDEMSLTKEQVGWCGIGAVSITVLARLLIGWLCDRIGPRLAYTWLLLLGSLPVMGIGLAENFETFLLFRVLIGAIGASFVITQYHTSVMFAPNCVGTANATTAGWGNLGAGVTQFAMPLLCAFFVTGLGFTEESGWRVSMLAAGVVCAVTGVAYFFLTQDAPDGNFRELRAAGQLAPKKSVEGSFLAACCDPRVWALFAIYGLCFGVELTFASFGALYFADYFDYFKQLDTVDAARLAGFVAAGYGMMNLFARTCGGLISDRCAHKWGLSGRVRFLFIALFCEGLLLMLFSQLNTLLLAIPTLMVFAIFVQMSNGATFSVVPFVNRKALGSVAGIVGAGGNAGAVAWGFLFKTSAFTWPTAFLILGAIVTASSFLAFAVRFSPAAESEARLHTEEATARRRGELLVAAT